MLVAQIFNLPYRRILFCGPSATSGAPERLGRCVKCKSAIQRRATQPQSNTPPSCGEEQDKALASRRWTLDFGCGTDALCEFVVRNLMDTARWIGRRPAVCPVVRRVLPPRRERPGSNRTRKSWEGSRPGGPGGTRRTR